MKMLGACIHCFKTEAERCDFNNDTAAIHIFIKDLKDTYNIAEKVYKRDPQTLSEVIRLVEKLNTIQQVTDIVSPSMVNMMSNDDNYFVFRKKGHIGCHFLWAQCCNSNDFGDYAQDCFKKIAPLRTPHHHNRSCSHSYSNLSHRVKSHSFHHRCSQGYCLDRSRSHHQPQCDRRSSHHQRHASHSVSCHNSYSHCPSTDRYTRRHSHKDTPHWHRCTTSSHSSCQSLSWHYSTDCNQSSPQNCSRSNYGSHTEKVSKPQSWRETPHRPQGNKKVTIQYSHMNSSSELDEDSDTLTY